MDLQCFCDYFEGRDYRGVALCQILDSESKRLAQPDASPLRHEIGQVDELWPQVSSVWSKLVGISAASGKEEFTREDDEELIAVALSLARFLRNLVAGVPSNQDAAFSSQELIRQLTFHFTSYSRSLEEQSRLVTKTLAQLLCNLVTGNDALLTSYWNEAMASGERDSILLRLLIFPDDGTKMATIIAIINCTKGSYRRSHQLTSTKMGLRILITLLDQLSSSFEEEDAEEPSPPMFELVYGCIVSLIELHLTAMLWKSLVMQVNCYMKDEPITPQQTELLKVLDAHLQGCKNVDSNEFTFLIPTTASLVSYARDSVKQALSANPALSPTLSPLSKDTETSDPNLSQAPDVKLPPVVGALVLCLQCSLTLSLQEVGSTEVTMEKTYSSGFKGYQSLIEDVVDLIRLLDQVLPRILWGKAQLSAPTPAAPSLLDSGADTDSSKLAFMNVKRDLVRVLGTMAYGDRAVQDRLRECGGIHVVLNQCVVDERNPYMREHALFALRNILEKNPTNQKLVQELEPMGKWDDEGMLRDTKGAVRR